MSWTQEEVQSAIGQVASQAATDAEFRKLALSDIHAAIRQATGKEVPASFKINVIDGTGYQANIVLPAFQSADGELNEAELEAVAGGSKSGATDFFNTVGNGIVTGATVVAQSADAIAQGVMQERRQTYERGLGL